MVRSFLRPFVSVCVSVLPWVQVVHFCTTIVCLFVCFCFSGWPLPRWCSGSFLPLSFCFRVRFTVALHVVQVVHFCTTIVCLLLFVLFVSLGGCVCVCVRACVRACCVGLSTLCRDSLSDFLSRDDVIRWTRHSNPTINPSN